MSRPKHAFNNKVSIETNNFKLLYLLNKYINLIDH